MAKIALLCGGLALRRDYAGDSLQVVRDAYCFPDTQQLCSSVCNCSTDFHDQPSPRFEGRARLRDQALDYFKPGRAGEDCVAWLEFPDFQLNLIFLGVAWWRGLLAPIL